MIDLIERLVQDCKCLLCKLLILLMTAALIPDLLMYEQAAHRLLVFYTTGQVLPI